MNPSSPFWNSAPPQHSPAAPKFPMAPSPWTLNDAHQHHHLGLSPTELDLDNDHEETLPDPSKQYIVQSAQHAEDLHLPQAISNAASASPNPLALVQPPPHDGPSEPATALSMARDAITLFLPAPHTLQPPQPKCPFKCDAQCEYRIWPSREKLEGSGKSYMFGHFCALCDKPVQVSSKKPHVYRPFRYNDDGRIRTAEEVAAKIVAQGHFPHSFFNLRGKDVCTHCDKDTARSCKKRVKHRESSEPEDVEEEPGEEV
jgi:hypothetical protein